MVDQSSEHTDYIKILDKISSEISQKRESESTLTFLSLETRDNIKIYSNNHLFNMIDCFKESYVAVSRYLGERNFNFFIKEMLCDVKITHSNIFDYMKLLPTYLERRTSLHQDEILVDLSKIDLLWCQPELVEIDIIEGVLAFWKEFILGLDSGKEINLNKREKIKVIEIEGENYLKVIESYDIQ